MDHLRGKGDLLGRALIGERKLKGEEQPLRRSLSQSERGLSEDKEKKSRTKREEGPGEDFKRNQAISP